MQHLHVVSSASPESPEEVAREDMELMTLHERVVYAVRELLTDKNWSCAKAAKIVGCHPSTLSKAARVKRGNEELYRRFESGEITLYKMAMDFDGKVLTNPTEARKHKINAIRDLAKRGLTAAQIAGDLNIKEQHVRLLANEQGIELADAVLGRVRRIDSRRVIEETVTSVDALALGIGVVDSFNGVTKEEAARWANTLNESLRKLGAFRKRLLEMAYHE